MISEQFCNLFLDDCKKANNKISLYLKNDICNDDYKSLGYIGHGGDVVKQIDIFAQDIFVDYLLKYANIHSEESGLIKSNNKNNKRIILDPIDGSDNLLCSLPYYGSSVSLEVNHTICIAFVYNFSNDEYICKTPYQNNIKLLNKYKSSLGVFERAYTKVDISRKLKDLNLKYRSPGATALSLANAMNYSFFLLAGQIRIEDISAGLYICSNLYIYKNDDYLLISKNYSIFCKIKNLL